jgi:hypothetical protein|tara:strand:+ start:429 stop:602 length:174 start_codon:yes stop_codon:yes gene_type:complete
MKKISEMKIETKNKAALLSLYRCGCPEGRDAFRRFMAGRNITNAKQALRVLIKQVNE